MKKPLGTPLEFCASRLKKPDVFCTLPPNHKGPCSFFLSGRLADEAIQHLRDRYNDLYKEFVELNTERWLAQDRADALADSIKKFREHFQGAMDGTCGVECPECETRFEAALETK